MQFPFICIVNGGASVTCIPIYFADRLFEVGPVAMYHDKEWSNCASFV